MQTVVGGYFLNNFRQPFFLLCVCACQLLCDTTTLTDCCVTGVLCQSPGPAPAALTTRHGGPGREGDFVFS